VHLPIVAWGQVSSCTGSLGTVVRPILQVAGTLDESSGGRCVAFALLDGQTSPPPLTL